MGHLLTFRSIQRSVVLTGFTVIVVLLVNHIDTIRVISILARVDKSHVYAAGGANLAYLVVRGLRLWLIMRDHGRMTVAPAIRISCLGVFASSLYPGLGETARIFLLRRRSLSISSALVAVLIERLLDSVALVALLASSWGLSYFRGAKLPTTAPAVHVGIAFGLAILLILGALRHQARRLAFRREAYVHRSQEDSVGSLRLALSASRGSGCRRGDPILIVAATASVHGLAIATAWLTIASFGLHPPIGVAAFLIALTNLGLAFVPLPLGLGIFQTAGWLALGPLGVTPESAFAVATMLQGINYGVTVLAAAPCLFGEMGPNSATVPGTRLEVPTYCEESP